ncbi:MAG: excinuclease ABC subunit UvrA [Planctomycetota bacterium]
MAPQPPGPTIRIRGARTHNLRDIDVDIPRNKLVVITGVSGSGKSSLAFDTLLAEGQRQYIDSLSVYARQFFNQMQRPDVDRIEGLQPAVAIDQSQGTHSPRSTVGTVTEVYDYLRLLYARCGDVACAACGAAISQQSPGDIQDAVAKLPGGSRVMLLAPLVRGRKGKHADAFDTVRKAGLVRVRVDGATYPIEDVPPLVPQRLHTIEAVVDRLVLRDGIDDRLAESIRLALKHGDGVVQAVYQTPDQKKAAPDEWDERLFNTRYACPDCDAGVAEIEPRTFSFNSPYGACPACEGFGVVGGGTPGDGRSDNGQQTTAEPCAECGGSRLRPEARAVTLGGVAIHELSAMSLRDACRHVESLELDADLQPVGGPLVREIVNRLGFLEQAGAEYLSLDRPAQSLSGGELQRVRLASGIGSGLVGVMYLLDEPSIGLHPRDTERLIASLRDLQRQGNTVIVVEHDEAIMRAADWLIDVGPGAGAEGGRVVAAGTPEEVMADAASVTGRYLKGEGGRGKGGRASDASSAFRLPPSAFVTLAGATLHNLKGVELKLPLHALTCVTGVSGSGKSSLIMETLAPALARKLHGAEKRPGPYKSLRGVNQIERCVRVDQSPIGRSPRSNAATYCGVFDEVRNLFAKTKVARQRGYKARRFSFNVKGGRCEACQGQGVQRIEMNFLPDLFVECDECRGRRFDRATLAVRYKQKSIADVLDMPVGEALEFFADLAPVARVLRPLADVGLGYLPIGQPATTLSGGEAQRIKLAAEVAEPKGGHTLYILDEPTTGLHAADVERLLGVLRRLVDGGNSVLVIEHQPDVMRAADWLIDMGPEGGAGGGQIVIAGTPAEVAACEASHTGRWLRV